MFLAHYAHTAKNHSLPDVNRTVRIPRTGGGLHLEATTLYQHCTSKPVTFYNFKRWSWCGLWRRQKTDIENRSHVPSLPAQLWFLDFCKPCALTQRPMDTLELWGSNAPSRQVWAGRWSDSFTVHGGRTWSKDAKHFQVACLHLWDNPFLGATAGDPSATCPGFCLFHHVLILQAHFCGPVTGLDEEWLPLPCANMWTRLHPANQLNWLWWCFSL